jgi:hypothetical protein
MTGEPDPDAGVVVVLSAATSPVHEDPIPAALAAIQAKITGGRTARLLLTDRVTALEGQAAVPGPAGPAGAAGAAARPASTARASPARRGLLAQPARPARMGRSPSSGRC